MVLTWNQTPKVAPHRNDAAFVRKLSAHPTPRGFVEVLEVRGDGPAASLRTISSDVGRGLSRDAKDVSPTKIA